MPNENAFEAQAKRILGYLRSDVRYDPQFLPRPFFVEITGTPSAGKTTTITELDKFFRRMGFRVLRPQEGAEVVRHIERSTPLYNLRTGMYALTMLIDLAHGHLYDIVIFDRCIFDAYCWMEYWEKKEKLVFTQKWLYQTFFLSPFWSHFVDAAYYMVCEPEEAMRRELKIALSQALGETTNPKTIELLVGLFRKAHGYLEPNHSQLSLIDTTRMNGKEMVELVASETLNTLEKKIKRSG